MMATGAVIQGAPPFEFVEPVAQQGLEFNGRQAQVRLVKLRRLVPLGFAAPAQGHGAPQALLGRMTFQPRQHGVTPLAIATLGGQTEGDPVGQHARGLGKGRHLCMAGGQIKRFDRRCFVTD